MKKKLVVMLLAAMVLTGCGKKDSGVEVVSESPANLCQGVITPYAMGAGNLEDPMVLLELNEPCKSTVLQVKDEEGTTFGVMGVKYSDEADILSFSANREVLSVPAQSMPKLYYTEDFSSGVCMVRFAETDEVLRFSYEDGFTLGSLEDYDFVGEKEVTL